MRKLKVAYPGIRVDRTASVPNIGGNIGVTGPEPNFDETVGSFHSIESSASCIERRTVAVCRGCNDTTSCVTAGVNVAVIASGGTSHAARSGHIAVCTGVECHGIGGLVIDTFDPKKSRVSIAYNHSTTESLTCVPIVNRF